MFHLSLHNLFHHSLLDRPPLLKILRQPLDVRDLGQKPRLLTGRVENQVPRQIVYVDPPQSTRPMVTRPPVPDAMEKGVQKLRNGRYEDGESDGLVPSKLDVAIRNQIWPDTPVRAVRVKFRLQQYAVTVNHMRDLYFLRISSRVQDSSSQRLRNRSSSNLYNFLRDQCSNAWNSKTSSSVTDSSTSSHSPVWINAWCMETN
ncbi:hypothetical protein HOY82DRAFT_597522 [Tuber indicum]|nr:hypothetical protein HOY82DRAFT_597522 [Tuber indicum]